MTLAEAALAYAKRGWAVIPLRPQDKRPLTEHGVKDATTKLSQVAAWWGEYPDANVGIATGEPSGFFVVDIDPRNRGMRLDKETREYVFEEALAAEYDQRFTLLAEVETRRAQTGSGGLHLLFTLPEGRLRGKLATGIDIKSTGGYIVAPPSVHPEGGVYEWLNDEDPAPAPDWLLELIVVQTEPEERRREPDPDDDRPGTRFNALASWREILEPHGWTFDHMDGETEYWRRPGKDEGISASANFEASGLFYVWSTSTDFEPHRGYDKVGVYALLNHGGDIQATIDEIRIVWVPDAPSTRFEDSDFEPRATPGLDRLMQEPSVLEHSYAPSFPADHFVSRYVRYCEKQTDAPQDYHEAGALSLLTLATPQLRANLAPYPGGLATNLYLLLVGPSTTSRKSTAQNLAADIAKSFRPSAELPASMSTEAMIERLANQAGVAKLWLPDEFGMTLAQIARRDYKSGIEELLLSLYGGKDYIYATKNGPATEIHAPHLSVLGAATPESLALAGPTALLGGLLPRFGVIFPRTKPDPRPAQSIDDLRGERRALINHLRVVQEHQQEQPYVVFDPQAVALLNDAEVRLAGEGIYAARLAAMLYKVASLSATGRLSVTVTEDDASSSVSVVNRWLDGARHLQPYMRHKPADIEFERMLTLTLEVIDNLGGSAPRWRVARGVKTMKTRLDQIYGTLVDRGYLANDNGTWKRVRE